MTKDQKEVVEGLSRDGVSLADIIFSGTYSEEVRAEALRLLRWNVVNLHRAKEVQVE